MGDARSGLQDGVDDFDDFHFTSLVLGYVLLSYLRHLFSRFGIARRWRGVSCFHSLAMTGTVLSCASFSGVSHGQRAGLSFLALRAEEAQKSVGRLAWLSLCRSGDAGIACG